MKQNTPVKVQKVVTPYAKIQLAAAKRAEEAEKQGNRKKKAVPAQSLVFIVLGVFCMSLSASMLQCISSLFV